MEAIKQARKAQAAVLIGITALIVGTITVVWGFAGFALAAITLPVPLALLWLARDVVRADELRAEPALANQEKAAPARPLRTAEQAT